MMGLNIKNLCSDVNHDCEKALSNNLGKKFYDEHDIDRISLDELISRNLCNSILFKCLISRIRRNSSRVKDWEYLKKIIADDIDFFKKNLNIRWKISILETYIDMGTISERKNALISVSIFNYEKIVQGYYRYFNIQPRTDNDGKEVRYSRNIFSMGNGNNTFHKEAGDMPTNFFARIDKELEPGVIKELFHGIMLDLINLKGSTPFLLKDFANKKVFADPYFKFLCSDI